MRTKSNVYIKKESAKAKAGLVCRLFSSMRIKKYMQKALLRWSDLEIVFKTSINYLTIMINRFGFLLFSTKSTHNCLWLNNLFRLKIGKIILSLPLIQKPIKIYADKNCELVYHGFTIIYKRFKISWNVFFLTHFYLRIKLINIQTKPVFAYVFLFLYVYKL